MRGGNNVPRVVTAFCRLRTVFLLVPGLHWILVEDSPARTALVTSFLQHSGLNHTHLTVQTPTEMKLKNDDPHWSKPRGVLQRNKVRQSMAGMFLILHNSASFLLCGAGPVLATG